MAAHQIRIRLNNDWDEGLSTCYGHGLLKYRLCEKDKNRRLAVTNSCIYAECNTISAVLE